jgi:O-antigen/teichoic acid export membrane protein
LIVPTGILVAAFLTRSLGPELYGLFTVAASIVLWIETAATMLLSRTAVKFIAEADNWRPVAGRLNRVQLGVSLAAMGLLVVAAPVISDWLHAPSLVPLLRLTALDIPIFALASLHRAFLIGRGAFARVAITTAARWLVRLALVFVLVGLGLSVTGAILATVGGSLASLLVTRAFIRPSLWGRASPAIPGMWGYAIPLFLGAMATQSFGRLDLLMVKALVSAPDAAGFYGAAQNLAIGPGLLAAAFSPLLLGTLSDLVRRGRNAEFATMVHQVFRLMLLPLPLVAIATPAASDLAALVYGSTFAPAGPATAVLLIAAAALFIVSVTATILTALGQPAMVLLLVAPLTPIALALHLFMIPRFGALGAAGVTAALAWAAALSGVLATAARAGVPLPTGAWMRIALMTAAGYSAAHAWTMRGPWVLLELAILTIFGVVALRFTAVVTPGELQFALSLLRPRRGRSAMTPTEPA